MIKAVIFDIDGTLIDSVELHAQAWHDVLQKYGCNASVEEIRNQIGKGGDHLLPVFLSREEIDRHGKQIEEERGKIFKEKYLAKVKPFPCVKELFQRIADDGRKLALASSAKADELGTYKRMTGIERFLDTETSSDDAEKSKPEPDIFLAAMDRLKSVAAEEIVVVGDSPYDAEAAGKAGMSAIGVLCGGFSREQLETAGCRAIYKDPADLLARYQSSPLGSAGFA